MIEELRTNISLLEHEKREKAVDRMRYEKEIEQLEENWKKESQELLIMISRLQDDNRKLSSSLKEHEQQNISKSMAPPMIEMEFSNTWNFLGKFWNSSKYLWIIEKILGLVTLGFFCCCLIFSKMISKVFSWAIGLVPQDLFDVSDFWYIPSNSLRFFEIFKDWDTNPTGCHLKHLFFYVFLSIQVLYVEIPIGIFLKRCGNRMKSIASSCVSETKNIKIKWAKQKV